MFHKGTHATSNFVWTIKTKDGVTRDFNLNRIRDGTVQPSLAYCEDLELIRNNDVLEEYEVVPVLHRASIQMSYCDVALIMALRGLRVTSLISVCPASHSGIKLNFAGQQKAIDGKGRSGIWVIGYFEFEEPFSNEIHWHVNYSLVLENSKS